MNKDEQFLISRAVHAAAFNGLLEEGYVTDEEVAYKIADRVEEVFVEESKFLVTK